MNHAVAIVSLDGNIHTRIEFDTLTDGETTIDLLEIRKSYLFDMNNIVNATLIVDQSDTEKV